MTSDMSIPDCVPASDLLPYSSGRRTDSAMPLVSELQVLRHESGRVPVEKRRKWRQVPLLS